MAKARTAAAERGKQNKSAFVRSLPEHMPAKDVVAKAKSRGMTMSIAYVYTVRTAARAHAKRHGGVPPRRGRRPSAGAAGGAVEDLLHAVAAELGLSRAIQILEGEQAKVRAILG